MNSEIIGNTFLECGQCVTQQALHLSHQREPIIHGANTSLSLDPTSVISHVRALMVIVRSIVMTLVVSSKSRLLRYTTSHDEC